MGDVYGRTGRRVGSVNAWNGVYDTAGRKIGWMDIYSSRVYDASGRLAGTADVSGNVHSAGGKFLCQVAFWGGRVKDAQGREIGSVEIAGAPDPPPDMQWRAAAALLLLCDPQVNPPDPDQLAFDYLTTLESIFRQQLLDMGAEAAPPLAKALAARLILMGKDIRSGRERQRVKDDWSAHVLEAVLRPAHELMTCLGSTAPRTVIRSFRTAERGPQKAAALLLAVGNPVDSGSVAELADMLKQGHFSDTTMVMLLTFVLAQGGDTRAQRGISDFAHSQQMDIGSCLAKTVDTALLELLGWGPGTAARF